MKKFYSLAALAFKDYHEDLHVSQNKQHKNKQKGFII
jgi:hypothetical protein